jgi:hypothetical protein
MPVSAQIFDASTIAMKITREQKIEGYGGRQLGMGVRERESYG